ncbi:MAG: YciI family protein [Planctomycetota bacterium]|nr:YciI family protein [Planctomycetota bacterium]
MKPTLPLIFGIPAISAIVLGLGQPTPGAATPAPPAPSEAAGRAFTLFVYETKDSFRVRTDPDRSGAYWGAFASYGRELSAAGVLRGGDALLPIESGTRIAMDGGAISSTPIVPSTNGLELGGSFVIEVADLAAATAWAEKCPAASTGMVIIRENIPQTAAMAASPSPSEPAAKGARK